MRIWKTYSDLLQKDFKYQALNYTAHFNHFAFFDSCNNTTYGHSEFNWLLAAGNYKSITAHTGTALTQFQNFIQEHTDWCFGYFGYDLKNEIEKLQSTQADYIQAQDLVFFIPDILIIQKENTISIGCVNGSPDDVVDIIKKCASTISFTQPDIHLIPRIPKKDYLQTIKTLQQHIEAGDMYEANICQEFYAEHVALNPLELFNTLCNTSKAPFSILMRWDEHYIISASPERFIKKIENKLISQPIKGTIKRGETKAEDDQLKATLAASEKDKAENVMIVDLVRNDFAKCAEIGSIKVEELFAIYSFEHVHQMVSKITATLQKNIDITSIIRHTFPMGSMTGAPKIMAMQLIDTYEQTKRGVFSGAAGYITPYKDFDFNVLIRTMLYNAETGYLSLQVGGAITLDSVPENEFDECLLKAAIFSILLGGKIY